MAEAKVQVTISAKDNASSVFNKIGGSASALGKTLAVGIAAGATAVAAGIGLAVKSAADFEKQMSAVKAASSATATEMGQLSGLALKLGADTSKSASEAARGIEELAKAGISVPDILNGAAQAAINLSEATGTDVATAAEVASAAMATFGKSAGDMAGVSDTVTGAVNSSALSVEGFALGIAQAGSAAAGVGLSFEDTATALTALARAGLSGSDAGTSLKNMLISMAAPTDTQAKAMRELGLMTEGGKKAFFDASGEIRSYSEIAGILQDKLGTLSSEQKIAALEAMFGRDAFRAAKEAMDLGAEGADALGAAVNRQGQTFENARARTDNLAGDMERLSGAAETAAIKLGQSFQEPLRGATQALTTFISESVTPFIEEHGPAFAKAATDAAKGLTQGAGSLAESAKTAASEGLEVLRKKLAELGPALAEWASTAGEKGKAVEEALTGVSGIALALQLLLQGNFKGAVKEADDALDHLGKAGIAAGKGLDEARVAIEKLSSTQTLLAGIDRVASDLGKTLSNLGRTAEIIVPPFLKAGGAAAAGGEQFGVWGAVMGALIAPILRFTNALSKISEGALVVAQALDITGAAFGAFASSLGTSLAAADTAVATLQNNIRTQLGVMVANAGTAMSEFGSTISNGLGRLVGTAFTQAQSIGSSIVNGVAGGIRAGAQVVANAAASMVSNALQAARNALPGGAPHSPWPAFVELGETIPEGLGAGIEEGAPEVEQVAQDLGQSVLEAMAAGLGKTKLLEGAADDLKGTLAGAMRDIAAEVDRLNYETERKFAEIGEKAGSAIREAISEAGHQVQSTIDNASRSIGELQESFGRGRAERAARDALTGGLNAVDLERSRNRSLEDLKRDRDREDKRDAANLARDIEKAKTAEEVAGILDRASEARDELLRRRREEDEDRDYRRKREDEDRQFRKAQDEELRRFDDRQDEEALTRSIQRANDDRDARIDAINQALEEKQRKIEEDAKEEQRKLLQATQDKITTLKDEFVAKLPPLTEEAQGIVERFLAGIDAALHRTAELARTVASNIGNISVGGGGGGGSGGGSSKGTSSFTIPLEGGGEMTVNASDMAAAIENVQVQGGTVAQQRAPEPHERSINYSGFHNGGVVPGPRGSDQMIMAAGGETVLPTHRSGGGIDYDLMARKIADALRDSPPIVSVDDIQSGLLRLGQRNGGVVGLS